MCARTSVCVRSSVCVCRCGKLTGGDGSYQYDWGEGFQKYSGFTICPKKDTVIRLITKSISLSEMKRQKVLMDTSLLELKVSNSPNCQYEINENGEINKEYLDKNHGQIFIFWDKWFGTFQEELNEVPAVFGITRPAQTWNPIKINFQHLWLLIQDAWRAENWKDKLRIWFMPTGWRPADVVDAHPMFTIYKMEELQKYSPTYTSAFRAFALMHLTVIFSLLCFLFFRFGEITQAEALTNGGLLFAAIFAFTAFLDKKLLGCIMSFNYIPKEASIIKNSDTQCNQ